MFQKFCRRKLLTSLIPESTVRKSPESLIPKCYDFWLRLLTMGHVPPTTTLNRYQNNLFHLGFCNTRHVPIDCKSSFPLGINKWNCHIIEDIHWSLILPSCSRCWTRGSWGPPWRRWSPTRCRSSRGQSRGRWAWPEGRGLRRWPSCPWSRPRPPALFGFVLGKTWITSTSCILIFLEYLFLCFFFVKTKHAMYSD